MPQQTKLAAGIAGAGLSWACSVMSLVAPSLVPYNAGELLDTQWVVLPSATVVVASVRTAVTLVVLRGGMESN